MRPLQLRDPWDCARCTLTLHLQGSIPGEVLSPKIHVHIELPNVALLGGGVFADVIN